MAVAVSVVHQIRGGDARELTGEISGVKLSQAAVGGFGSAEFSMAGDKRNRLGYLGIIKFFHGSSLLWEGQLEDQGVTFDESTRTTHVRAFGLRRKFDETSVRRIWSKRDHNWRVLPVGVNAKGTSTPAVTVSSHLPVSVGTFDVTDSSKLGIRVTGDGTLVGSGVFEGGIAEVVLPSGLSIQRLICTVLLAGANTANLIAYVAFLKFGTGTAVADSSSGTGTFNVNVGGSGSADVVHLGAFTAASCTPAATDRVDLTDIRILGTSLTEDVAGGYYGGTILRDLVSLCPDLTPGIIEDGSDFTIQAIERSIRNTAASVVSEVAGYYTREWAVWEDGRFDWKTRNLDEAQWIVQLSDLDGLNLDASVDDLARTVYVLYTDAASGLDAEASASSTDQRNPYFRQGKTKDTIVSPGFPMTANTSAQLASRIAGDAGARPSVGGTCVIAADRMIRNAVGEPKPAALIRAGENISFPELPKTDVMLRGRDGETLFHIASVELDVDNNTVTITLEGQQRRTDVILARLAAATRVLTG